MFCSEYILPLVSAAAISISGELSFDSYQDVTSPTFLHGEFVGRESHETDAILSLEIPPCDRPLLCRVLQRWIFAQLVERGVLECD